MSGIDKDYAILSEIEPERTVVPLRGIDFTGLGFNVCGNMRDGIYIKDVLHRGPAMESGKIKAGDRILSLTVSFANMVYEDALTILSYASPYDVQIEIQKMSEMSSGHAHSHQGHQKKGSNSSNISSSGIGMANVGNCGRERLYHPLYRSQSIGDLSKIGKDDSPAKRSSSIGGAAMVKPPKKEPFTKLGQSFNEECSVDVDSSKLCGVNATANDVPLTSMEISHEKPKTSRFRVEKVVENDIQVNAKKDIKSSAEIAVHEPGNLSLIESRQHHSFSKPLDEFVTVELNDDDDHQVKRNHSGDIKHDEEDVSLADGVVTTMQISPDIHAIPLWVTNHQNLDSDVADSVAIQTNFSSDNDSSSDDENVTHLNEINAKSKAKSKIVSLKEVTISGADRRASSLGDLTSVDEMTKKNFPLERSVSMDLNHAELIHGKLAMQQIEQLGPKLNENGAFRATENLHFGSDGDTNGHCQFLKSWDQVESLVHVGDEEEREESHLSSLVDVDLPPPIPISPVSHLNVGNHKKDEGDLWEVDLSERELSDEICSTLSDDSEEPQMKKVPQSKPPPPPTIKRMVAVDAGLDQIYDTSSSEDETNDSRPLVNVLDVNDSDSERLHQQPTSFIHHDVNTGSSTVTIGSAQLSADKQKTSSELDPEMARIFNNVTVSNTSRDLFTLDIDNWVQNGSQSENDNGFRNGNDNINPVVVKEQYESVMNFDLESPGSEMDKVGVIRFESTPPVVSGNNIKKSSSQSSLTELSGVSRTLIIANPQLSNTSSEIRLTIDQPPSLQPPPQP
ncbi:hypothetical protein CHUAL_004384 [Chamberlinius hualienensis]